MDLDPGVLALPFDCYYGSMAKLRVLNPTAQGDATACRFRGSASIGSLCY